MKERTIRSGILAAFGFAALIPISVAADTGAAALGECTAWPGAVTISGVGFSRPESATWDSVSGFWYLSNQGTQAGATDGFISRIDRNDALAQLKWVSGLGNPSGMRILDGVLYVADPLYTPGDSTTTGNAILAIDIATGRIVRTYALATSLMNSANRGINDLVVDRATHAIYITVFSTTDGQGETILKVPMFGNGSDATRFVAAGTLDQPGPTGRRPNGLLLYQGGLIVINGEGNFRNVDLHTGSVELLGSTSFVPPSGTPILDGLERDGNGLLFTQHGLAGDATFGDYLALIRFSKNRSGTAYWNAEGAFWDLSNPDQQEEKLCTLAGQGAADIGFDPGRRMVAIPHLFGDKITFITLRR